MSDKIEFVPDRPRTHFTFYGITAVAVLQLREYSRGERDFADGKAFRSLYERKLCTSSGKFKVDQPEAHALVNAAYSEGWHVRYHEKHSS